MPKPAKTETIIKALHIIADEMDSPDGVPNAALREAAERLTELERDAARYRWLRGNACEGRMETRGPRPDFALNCDEPESEWDAAIDAAMEKTP